eukprot:jgi/Galph1/503/GphlegSOOS_G5245.1
MSLKQKESVSFQSLEEEEAAGRSPFPPFSWFPCDSLLLTETPETDGSQQLDLGTGKETEYKKSFQCIPYQETSTCVFRIQLSRPFIFDQDKNEFRWHKTWKVPDIRISFKGDVAACSDLEAQAVCACSMDGSKSLEVVGLEGTTRQPLLNGQCSFNRLRFKTTSPLQRGRLLYLVISITRKEKCLASVISKGIYVYSRKNADKKRKKVQMIANNDLTDRNALSDSISFYAPFPPEWFDRVFVRKANDHCGHKITEKIDNSPKGLLAYFQAPNIRFKSRHPVFLLYRFSNALMLLRDSELFPEEDEKLFSSFLASMGTFNIGDTASCNTSSVHSVSVDLGNKPQWYICCRQGCKCNTEARRKIFENMELVKSNAIGFVADSSICDSKFKPVQDMERLRLEYERLYTLYAMGTKKRTREEDIGRLPEQIVSSPVDSSPASNESNESNKRDPFADFDIASSNRMEFDTCNSKEQLDFSEESFTYNTKARFFKAIFYNNHQELHHFLSKLTEAASEAVTDHSSVCINRLQTTFHEFFRSLNAHASVEDVVIFPILSQKIPGVTEAYNLDHFMAGRELTAIGNAILHFDPNYAGDLFLRISGFGASLVQHMQKEEEHILPHLLNALSEEELGVLRDKVVQQTNAMKHMTKNFSDIVKASLDTSRTDPVPDNSTDSTEDISNYLY